MTKSVTAWYHGGVTKKRERPGVCETATARVDSLVPHPQNYRRHGPGQLAHIEASLRANGVYRPVVVADDGATILAGHGVVEACRRVGVEEVSVARLPFGPDDPRALRVLAGDNEVSKGAEVDDRLLAEILRSLSVDEDGLLGTGYDDEAFERLVHVSRTESETRADIAAEWEGMPEYEHEDKRAFRSVVVHFQDADAVATFERLLGRELPERARATSGFPTPRSAGSPTRGMRVNPRFPLYVPSKGRADTRLTAKALDRICVPFRVVVEEQERSQYEAAVGASRVLVLDPAYQRDYDTFDDLGDLKSKGPGPARNFIWDHAVAEGHEWHWVMDDNINFFARFNRNLKVPVADGTVFRCMEDFCLRYENVAMAGPHYWMFVSRKSKSSRPFVLNTRIYSCNLIRNDTPYRWRGRYNEDTDLSLRMLKDGWCTVQFNAFLQYKMPTQTIAGGNTEAFYAREGTAAKSRMQVAMHPDVSKLVWRFGRWHHHVDYKGFKGNRLVRRGDVEVSRGVDDYGMRLVQVPRG